MRKLSRWISALILCGASGACGVNRDAAPVHADAGKPVIAAVRIAGTINPVQARHVERAVARARELHASLLLVSVDTPGGLVTSMQQIVTSLTNSGLPVVGLVEPATAQATSAGAFIMLATDLAAMLPDTRIGAAHPVGVPAGDKLDDTMAQKATNSLVSLAKGLATRHGHERSPEAAEAMVRDSASYTASEAQDKHVIEWQVNSQTELLERLHGHVLTVGDRQVTLDTRGRAVVEIAMSWSDRALDRLADPTLASILVSIGVLGILYELGAPGVGLGGIVGVTSLLLGLMGLSVLPINVVGVLLMLAGALALGFELHVPTHGIVGVGGIVALTCGGLMLFDASQYFGALPRVQLYVQLPVILLLGALLLLIAAQAARALEARPTTGAAALLGLEGVAGAAFTAEGERFAGMVRVQGTYWRALSTTPIDAAEIIEVLEVETQPLQLHVQRSRKGRV